jgi:hypothetical protein
MTWQGSGLAVPGRPIRSWSQRTGALEAAATGRDRKPVVHAGHTRSRHVSECNGHERTRPVPRNRRSGGQDSGYQGAPEEPGQSSVSLPAAASPPGSCPRGAGHRGRASPFRRAGSRRCHVRAIVVLADRATHVPQAAVTSSIQRTVTVTPRRPVGRAHVPDLGWGRRPKLHGMQAETAWHARDQGVGFIGP